MTNDPGHDRFTTAWRAFKEHDARIHAPAHLEAVVMAALRAPRRRRSTRPRIAMAVAASLAAIAGVWTLSGTTRQHAPEPLRARMMPPTPLPTAPIVRIAHRRTLAPSHRRTLAPPHPRTLAPATEETTLLMVFDHASPTETLQLVRLRVPGEALLALGLAPFEPDASGLVDIDLLVGDDGLPKNIRRVRVLQEER